MPWPRSCDPHITQAGEILRVLTANHYPISDHVSHPLLPCVLGRASDGGGRERSGWAHGAL